MTAVRRLGLPCLAWVLLTLAYSSFVQAWMARSGQKLGWVGPAMAPPLHASWATQLPGPWAIPCALILGVVFAFRDRLFRARERGPLAFVLTSILLFGLVSLATALSDGPVETRDGRIVQGFLIQHTKPHLESFGDVPRLEGRGLRGFSAMYSAHHSLAKLANHSRSHPPGPVVFQWIASRAFGTGLWVPPMVELLFGSLLIGLTYLIGRELFDEATARLGVGLTMVAPNVVMFATSMDLAFGVFLLFAGWLFLRAAREGSVALSALSGLAMSLSAFMTFSTIVLVVLIAIWFSCEWFRSPGRRGTMVKAAAVGAVTCWISFAGILWVSGYDLPRALPVQFAFDAGLMGSGTDTFEHYLMLSFANLSACLIGVGAPIVCLSAAGLGSPAEGAPRGPESLLLATASTIALFAFSSLYSLEVERIWLFLTPLLALPAARRLTRVEGAGFDVALGFACVYLFLAEAALVTAW